MADTYEMLFQIDPLVVAQDPALLVAIGVIITALTGLLGAVTVLLNALNKKGAILEKKVDDVHTLVNNHSSDQTTEIRSLTRALADSGVRIPNAERLTASAIPKSDSSVADAKGRAPSEGKPVEVEVKVPMEMTGTVTGTVTEMPTP